MNRVTLPANHVVSQSFEYGCDVNLGTRAAPSWQSIRRISGWAPTFPRITTDVATYDDEGDPNEDVTGRGFGGAFTVQGNRNVNTGKYLPEVEAILAAAKAKGEAAILDIRFYHKPAVGAPNPDDAGRASVTVEVTRGNTANSGVESISVTLTGKGSYEPIANPFAGNAGSTTPAVRTATPTAQTAGKQVTITGTGFTGATDVKFGATSVAAGAFTVVNDSTIVAALPAGSAGSAPIVVTTPVAASEAFAYTRGA